MGQLLRDSVENKPASLLVVPLGKTLSGISHLGVVDRWLATPKRARIAHRSLSRDRRINTQLTNYGPVQTDGVSGKP